MSGETTVVTTNATKSPCGNSGAPCTSVERREGRTNSFRWTVTTPCTDTGQASEALAEELSSSLASIAEETLEKNHAREKEYSNHTSKSEAVSSSEEGGVDSSSGSSGKSSDPAVVTANATTSSGEDRISRLRNEEAANNNSSSSDDRFVHASQLASARVRDTAVEHTHHHHSRLQKRRDVALHTSSDGYGLPVPQDDRLKTRSESLHATVVAHLPPPNSDGTSSGSGGEADRHDDIVGRELESLLQPHREPGFHTIRRTFNQFLHRHANKSSETDSSGDQPLHRTNKHSKRQKADTSEDMIARNRSYRAIKTGQTRSHKDGSGSTDENGGSSGSGTEGGYAGSASSNDPVLAGSCSSPSVSSSESLPSQRLHLKGKQSLSGDPNRPMLSKKQESSISISSEIADFSSGSSESAAESFSLHAFRESSPSPSDSPSITSSSNQEGSSDDQEEVSIEAKKGPHNVKIDHRNGHETEKRTRFTKYPLQLPTQTNRSFSRTKRVQIVDSKPAAKLLVSCATERKPPIMSVGCDVIAHILTFLEPPHILDVLTAPLSKDWLTAFTRQSELWRVLCLLEPFKARVEDDSDESSDDSISSFPFDIESQLRQTFGKFRLLYTSFVRCMRYLARIKEDASNGRAPSMLSNAGSFTKVANNDYASNQNLRLFLARARGVVQGTTRPAASSDISDDDDDNNVARRVAESEPVGLSDDGSSSNPPRKRKCPRDTESKSRKKIKFAPSKLTSRLLGPTESGDPGDRNLPWSCAIYSIVNWMVAFSDVEGIQTMCMKVLPLILENEQHRMTAQRAGLTDIVLRGMVMFPNSSLLHTAASHTIVLLARPLGGQEGMLFHTSMVNASGIFDKDSSQGGKNGIAVMLDSMRRFQSDGVLQAMSCWSLVNIALSPAQKQVLVKLGGIEATANAMMGHPYNAEVQVRMGVYHRIIVSYSIA